MKSTIPRLVAVAFLIGFQTHAASFFEWLGFKKARTNAPAKIMATLSSEEINDGLKQALAKGVERAVSVLGKEDGFLKDLSVKIPMPESLTKVERTLRTLRQDQLADEFVVTMNRAAEKAVPEAAAVLIDAVKLMTLEDARAILVSTNNAATAYFRRTSETNLFERFLPIVRKATEEAGVTSAYKKMTEMSIGGFSATSIFGRDALDLDGYVTRKALDGLFLKIADEERRIRENPVARTSELLQKVFGAVSQPPKLK